MGLSLPLTGQNASVFRFGEFTLDSRSHLLMRNGVQQHLSPKAQQLLYLLLTAWPSARSRQDIYDALWPSTFVCETNMAGVVGEVRKALGDDARSAQYIRTVHGFGYAFCGEVIEDTPQRFEYATLRCEGQRHPLFAGENLVGRAPDCRVVLTDRSVSRHHAVIIVRNESLWLEDRDSKNGTYVDSQRIQSAPVTSSSRILFGAVPASIRPRRFSSTGALRLDMIDLKRQVDEHISNG